MSSLMFKGYQLIRLDKAIDESTGIAAFTYETTVHDVFGRASKKNISVSQLDRDWCKLRMQGDRFAMMIGGVVKPITEEEYNKLTGIISHI